MPTIEIIQAAREFYQLLALESIVIRDKKLEPFRKSHERWLRDFTEYKSCFVKGLAHLIFDYTVIAVGGEMRHGVSKSPVYLSEFPSSRNYSRTAVFRLVSVYDPKHLLQAAVKLFSVDGWESGYGGKAWANIAKAGLMYGNIPDEIFIDHCVDLSHNSSVYFDKPDNGILWLGDVYEYKKFLDFKYTAEPEEILLNFGKSRWLRDLVFRAANIGLLVYSNVHYMLRKSDAFTSMAIDVLGYKEKSIVWGSKTFSMILEESCYYTGDGEDDDDEDDEDEDDYGYNSWEDDDDEEEEAYAKAITKQYSYEKQDIQRGA